MADNKNQNSQNYELQGWEAPLALALVGGGFWHKYGRAFEVWFHLHVIKIAICTIALFVLGGYLIVWRLQKKNKDEIERMRRLQKAKAAHSKETYYRKPTGRNGDDQS